MEIYKTQYVGEAMQTTKKLNELAGKASEMIGRKLTENELLEMRGFGDYFLAKELQKAGLQFYNGRLYIAVTEMPAEFKYSVEEVNSLLAELKEISMKLNFKMIVKDNQLIICPDDELRLNASF